MEPPQATGPPRRLEPSSRKRNGWSGWSASWASSNGCGKDPPLFGPEILDAGALMAGAAARFESRSAAQGVSVDVAGAAPGEPELSVHRRPAGGRADPAEPHRERALGSAAGAATYGCALRLWRYPADRRASRSASPTTGRASRPARPRRSSIASSGPIRRAAAAVPGWGWPSSASWPGPTAARPGPRTSPRTAPASPS